MRGKMNSSRERGRKSLFISIRKAPAQNLLPYAYKDEKTQTPILSFDALRAIGRIVRAIKKRLQPDHDRAK